MGFWATRAEGFGAKMGICRGGLAWSGRGQENGGVPALRSAKMIFSRLEINQAVHTVVALRLSLPLVAYATLAKQLLVAAFW